MSNNTPNFERNDTIPKRIKMVFEQEEKQRNIS